MARLPDADVPREHTIQTRVTKTEKASIDQSRKGLKLSTWLRQAAVEKIERDR